MTGKGVALAVKDAARVGVPGLALGSSRQPLDAGETPREASPPPSAGLLAPASARAGERRRRQLRPPRAPVRVSSGRASGHAQRGCTAS